MISSPETSKRKIDTAFFPAIFYSYLGKCFVTIRTRIITVIALTVILTVGTTTLVVVGLQKRRMAHAGIRETKFLCDLIEKTAESAMIKGKKADIQKVVESVGGNSEIMNLRILSPEGKVLESADRSEIGSKPADLPASLLVTPNREKAIVKGAIIDYFQKIPNRKECFRCHAADEKTLGIIQITHNNSRNYNDFLAFVRLLMFFCLAMVVIVPAAMSSLFSRLVMKPLKSLVSAMREVEAGNWNASAEVEGDDELGKIGTSFNKMIREVDNLYKKDILKERELSRIRIELEHKNKVEELNSQLEFNVRELEAANEAVGSLSDEVRNKNVELEKAVERLKKINEVGRTLSSVVDTEEVTKVIIQTASDLLNTEKVTIHLRNTSGTAVTMQYVKGEGIRQLDTFSPDYATFTGGGTNLPSPVGGSGPEGSAGSGMRMPLEVKGHVIGVMVLENSPDRPPFNEDELEALTTLSNQAMVAIENARLYENVKNNYFATIQSLVNALEASDRFTKGHSERVRLLSVELGKSLNLDFKELELLEHAAILHDIGKIGIDNFVLQKQGRLTSREYGLVKTHPLIGDEILGPIENLGDVRKTIIQHHERYDGTGYPYGLRGEEISLTSRILSVVDTFDAMMTDRPYRKALLLKHVIDELEENSGTQFDPAVVETFVAMLEKKGDQILSESGYNAMFSI